MPLPAFTHFVFVDFENVPRIDLALVKGKPVHVTLLIGKKQTWLDLSLVQQIHRMAEQVELVEVGASGRNALDLTLAVYLGQAVQRKSDAQFTIVSKDKDFEAMISHLAGKGIKVVRSDSFTGAFPPAAKIPLVATKPGSPAKKATTDRLEKFIAHLRNSPPANRTKLEHMITAFFKPSLPVGGMKGVINELKNRKVLSIDSSGKVTLLSKAVES